MGIRPKGITNTICVISFTAVLPEQKRNYQDPIESQWNEQPRFAEFSHIIRDNTVLH